MTQFSSDKTLITKENAYPILKAFAKEYKKQNGTSFFKTSFKSHTSLSYF